MKPPLVRFVFACDSAVQDLVDQKWSIKNPWYTVQMPPGVTKGHGQRELWLYAQLTDGLGTFDLGVELQYFQSLSPSGFVLGRSGAETRTFAHPLQVHEVVFRMVKVPFPRKGQYEFRVMAQGQPLQNGISYLDVV